MKNQKSPSGGGEPAPGFSISKTSKPEEKTPPEPALPPPTLRDIRPEDLSAKHPERILDLHREAVDRGLINSSEHDRLNFVSAAVHAQAVGKNPPKLFAWFVWKGKGWKFITQADEDEAMRRLKPPRL